MNKNITAELVEMVFVTAVLHVNVLYQREAGEMSFLFVFVTTVLTLGMLRK